MPESYKVLLGTYKLDTTEGFEEFMVRLGVSPFMLLSDGVTKPVTIIRQSRQIWILTPTPSPKSLDRSESSAVCPQSQLYQYN